MSVDVEEPCNWNVALESSLARRWREAAQSEFESLQKMKTWDLVPLPDGKNVVGSKWVFKMKRNYDNTISRFKARLVAQGYSQERGLDYEEVFAPVAKQTTIRVLLAIATELNLAVHQMDIKTAFLNGFLDEEIFMKQPEGFEDSKKPEHVCRLNRSLYGLKQAARCWNSRLDAFLKKGDYQQLTADTCVYLKKKKNANGDFVIMIVYVDDILMTSNNHYFLVEEKARISEHFALEVGGEVHHILGMTIMRRRSDGICTVKQNNFTEAVLKRFNMFDCNPVGTPMETSPKLLKLTDQEQETDKMRYQQVIGSLIYLMTATRPDLSYPVGFLSQFMARPGEKHWGSLKRVLRYINGSHNMGLFYECSGEKRIILTGYSDANWANDLNDRISTSGYLFFIGNSLISWKSQKQRSVARSTTEAEYVALSECVQEAIWLRRLLEELGFKQEKPTVIFEDNQGAIDLSKNPKFHNRTKHIDISYHFTMEKIASEEIVLQHCASNEMLADVMTKRQTSIFVHAAENEYFAGI